MRHHLGPGRVDAKPSLREDLDAGSRAWQRTGRMVVGAAIWEMNRGIL